MTAAIAPTSHLRCSTCVILVGASVLTGLTHAVAAAQTSIDQSVQLEEIVITAQKRTENLQQVPISAQVIGGQAIAEQNFNTLEDLSRTVPSVQVSSGFFASNLYIRGVGSNAENAAVDQSVSTFNDDIYHGRSRLSEATFLDLDRIEVLKGPQTTFFGNNAIAGALNIITKKPSNTFDASARGLYGMFGQYALEAAVGGPLTDVLSARVAVTRNGDDRGWIDNINTDQHVPRINNLAGRVTIDFHPDETLDAALKIEASQHRQSGTDGDPRQFVNCPPAAPLTPGFGGVGGQCAEAIALGVPVGVNSNTVSLVSGQGNQLSTFEPVLTLNFHRWDHTFTSVSGVNSYHYDATIDQGNLPVPFFSSQLPEKYHQFSQELRVASPVDQPIEYMAGGYFQTDQLDSAYENNAPFLNFIGGLVPPLAPYLPLAVMNDFTQKERVYSIFGSVSWNATDRLKFNAGLRGSKVNKDLIGGVTFGTGTKPYGGFVPVPSSIAPIYTALGFGPDGTSPSVSRSDHAWMPSANIQYQLDTQSMIYLSYSRGFKAGAINGPSALNPPEQILVNPEHVNAYELGLKSKWLDNRLLFNLDVFRSDYQDLQVFSQVFIPIANTFSSELTNAAQSRSQGAEFETQWAATQYLRFSANVTYLESYYVSFRNSSPSNLQTFCAQPGVQAITPQCAIYPTPVPATLDASGQPTSYAPRWSGSVTAGYTVPLFAGYKFNTLLSPFFTSKYNSSNFYGDQYIRGTDSYVRLDARFGIESPDAHWAVDLIGKNLTDRVIVIEQSGLYTATKEQPRNVAIQFRYHW